MHPSIIQRIRSSVRKPRPEAEILSQKGRFVIGVKGLIREKQTAEAPRPISDNSKLGDLEERNKIIETENVKLRKEIRERRKLLREKKELINKLKEEIASRKELVLSMICRSLRRIEEEKEEPNVMDYPDALPYLIDNGAAALEGGYEGPVHHSINSLG